MNIRSFILAFGVLSIASLANAATVDNFDDISTGTLAGTNTEIVQLGTIGSPGNRCTYFSAGTSAASGNILCAIDTDGANVNAVPETLTFADVNFDLVTEITFDMAAFTPSGFFFEESGTNVYDFVSITAAGTEIVLFERDPNNTRVLTSDIGSTNIDGTFSRFTIDSSLITVTGVGDLVFSFSATAVNEGIAFDNIAIDSVPAVPLPASGLLLLAALAGAGFAVRRL